VNGRSHRMLQALVRQLERFSGEVVAAPASSDFMRGYRKGCSDTYRACADWIVEAVPELAEQEAS
jgi:hypothetical protein